MTTYMITYFVSDTCGCGGHDHNHDHNHEHVESSESNIIGKIKSLGAWAHFMPEGYLVKSESSAKEMFEEIQSVSNKGDLIFITKVEGESCTFTNPAVVEWINS